MKNATRRTYQVAPTLSCVVRIFAGRHQVEHVEVSDFEVELGTLGRTSVMSFSVGSLV